MASTESTTQTPRPTDRPPPARRSSEKLISLGLGLGAVVGWWWSVRMAADMRSSDMGGGMTGVDAVGSMSMSLAAFIVGWAAMMAAMMFPAIAPMLKMYAGAARARTVAPVPAFVAGYLALWTVTGLPAYVAWRSLAGPLAAGAPWTGRLAGAVFVLAAVYQLTPLKTACLTQCRSPVSFFLTHGGTSLARPRRAAWLGAHHGLFCLGCCWAIMAILVVLGTMNLVWMAVLTAVVVVEKVAPRGETFANAFAVAFAVAGLWLVADPSLITTIT